MLNPDYGRIPAAGLRDLPAIHVDPHEHVDGCGYVHVCYVIDCGEPTVTDKHCGWCNLR